jgi:hypothetical protein
LDSAAIARTEDRLDVTGPGRIWLNFTAQVADMNINRTLDSLVAVSLKLLEELFTAEDPPRSGHHDSEEGEL